MLLIGTNDGVYQAPIDELDNTTHVLESEHALRIHQFDESVYAATRSGLFRSMDAGETWVNLDVPRREVYSVLQNSTGERLYAGTHPAHLYVSTNDGESWRELEGLQELPSRQEWRLPRHRNEAHVRSLGAHPDTPQRVVAGIEVGGVHVSDDEGETWTERRDGVHDDVHHVLVQGSEEYIASCGGGLYRTRNAGRSWTRLDVDFEHTYFREAFSVGGRLYAAAARSSPPSWGGERGPDAALFESTDDGDTFESVSYPGKPQEFILAWTALDDGTVIAGTRGGHILRRTNEGWTRGGSVPAGIRSLTVV
ncbi:WD40/YVTN/BNR-like repeat-containing protein [Haladaptatus halobius]|uniref:WD40/YVTN/BNR-like repeat-containing protein n=1 Tax=Haladaptatus halobius TaxID=2884875 RepID=UPI001D0A21E4|nr:glycosyl hydrolase [Haladaptatus halobius]